MLILPPAITHKGLCIYPNIFVFTSRKNKLKKIVVKRYGRGVSSHQMGNNITVTASSELVIWQTLSEFFMVVDFSIHLDHRRGINLT